MRLRSGPRILFWGVDDVDGQHWAREFDRGQRSADDGKKES
jgi:hypothetical protein